MEQRRTPEIPGRDVPDELPDEQPDDRELMKRHRSELAANDIDKTFRDLEGRTAWMHWCS